MRVCPPIDIGLKNIDKLKKFPEESSRKEKK